MQKRSYITIFILILIVIATYTFIYVHDSISPLYSSKDRFKLGLKFYFGNDHQEELHMIINNVSTTKLTKELINNDNNIQSLTSNAAFKEPIIPIKLYYDNENILIKTSIYWADFLELKTQPLRSIKNPIKFNIKALNLLKICPAELSLNLTMKPSNNDMKWCNWAVSATGGQAIPGKSFGKLNSKDREKYDSLKCNHLSKGIKLSCDDEQGDSFIQQWKRNIIKDLCEANAISKINCFDSHVANSRICIFDNAMMDFKKMRYIQKPDGGFKRNWEKGFLSADCGFSGKDNIGYLQLYQPDIQGSSDAVCDYYFNETVIAYSHDNIKSLGHMMNDYINVWSTMWLSDTLQQAKDITFLNIDSIKGGKYNNDEPNKYFKHYDLTFRRVIKAIDFGKNSKVCFKKLIMQPRPVIPYIKDGWLHDIKCSFTGPSSLFQRYNLQIRQIYNLIRQETMPTMHTIQILILTLPYRGSDTEHDIGLTSRIFSNIKKIEIELKKFATAESIIRNTNFNIVIKDINTISYEEQIKFMFSSSVVISMHGAHLSSTMHMPVGTKHCCGVIEIFPDGEFNNIKGYSNMIRRMGHHYSSLLISKENTYSAIQINKDANNNVNQETLGSTIPTVDLINTVSKMLDKINNKPSCLLSNVVKSPSI